MNQEMNCEILKWNNKLNYLTLTAMIIAHLPKTPALKAIGGGSKTKMEKLLGLVYGWLMKCRNMSMEKRLHRFM